MANKKKAARSNPSAASAGLARLEQALPGRLADYVGQLQSRLDRLEKQISAAQDAAMRQATRMLRDASRQLGQFEERGETAWQRLGARYRQEAARLLRRLEETLAPLASRQTIVAPSKKTAKTVRRSKSASRKRSASRMKSTSRTKAAARKRTKTTTKSAAAQAAARKSAKRKPTARRSSKKKRAGSRRRSSR